VRPVAVLATQVDAMSVQRTLCTTSGGDMILTRA
jgi:hypothetical protein